MKPSKSPENVEVTPSKKKLKQARLPFKLISEVSPTPITPQTRKRKLSAADAETVNKIGKLSKENDLADHTVVLSDDETVITDDSTEQQKPLNPFVKLVDTAWKKKLQKGKKLKTDKKSKDVINGSTNAKRTEYDIFVESKNEVELMDVDMPLQPDENKMCEKDDKVNGTQKDNIPNAKKATPKRKRSRKSRSSPRCNSKSPGKGGVSKGNDVVVVEDSNSADEPGQQTSQKTTTVKKDDNAPSNEEKIINEDIQNEEEKSNVTKDDESIPNVISLELDSSSKDEESAVEQRKNDNPSDSVKQTEEVQNEDEIVPDPITPKRSSRNKTKVEEKEKNLNKSTSKLDESISSNPMTPIQNRSLSVTNSLDDSLNESTASANLTPKQLQKKLEAAKKREERDKEKQERDKKKQQEKEEKAKQRQEKEEQKKKEREEKEEAKRKEREEKEEQRRKEKEEKDRQRELEKKQREEKEEQKKKEREEKEEQKRKEKEAKEEERRKKQEALEQEKQEQELKKKKAAEAFVNFFVPKQKSEKDQASTGPVSKSSVLSSFAIKSDMRLAPTIRVDLTDEKKEALDSLMVQQSVHESDLYLKSLKEGILKPLSDRKTWPLSDKDDDDDVMIVEDELPPIDGAGEIVTCEPAVREKLRPKLLSFHKNRRPPYWGTWRKKSAHVTPRRPFGQEKKYVDYEVDSDEEWEEEPEGESVDGSAAGSDVEEDADEYEVDNELFVPHGYLSDEEATMDDDDVLSLSPETQKARLKHLEDEFESEMKKPTEKLKPRLYGILWENGDGGKPEKCVDALWNYFNKLAMIMNDPTPLMQPSKEPEEAERKKNKKKKVTNDAEKRSPKSDKNKKIKPENKETKPKVEQKKNTTETKKNQPGINSFLTKLKST